MFEYISMIIGMHTADGIISSVQAELPKKSLVVTTTAPMPAFIISREQRLTDIRRRFEQQSKDDKQTPDPHSDMWDPTWINKP
jgi:hypothetical protein